MKLLSTIIVFLFSTASYAQQSSDQELAFKITSANIYFNKDATNTAKNAFADFIASRPNSDYRIFATCGLAEIYKRFGEIDSAIYFYKQAFDLPAFDNINKDLKHQAAKNLGEIYLERKEFETAFNYIEAAKNKYLAVNECGNSAVEDLLI